MRLNNKVLDTFNLSDDKYWTFSEVIDILKRNDPDELFKYKFIRNFRCGQPADGVENPHASDYRMIQYLLNDPAAKLGLSSYYKSMTNMVIPGRYEYRLYHLVFKALSKELRELEYIPKSTYDDIYKVLISRLPQDGSINIFEEIKKLDLEFLLSLRTDLTKYDIALLCILSEYKDKYPLNIFTRYMDVIHDLIKSGYDVDVILRSVMEVENEGIN